jgi:hypothetical protein
VGQVPGQGEAGAPAGGGGKTGEDPLVVRRGQLASCAGCEQIAFDRLAEVEKRVLLEQPPLEAFRLVFGELPQKEAVQQLIVSHDLSLQLRFTLNIQFISSNPFMSV